MYRYNYLNKLEEHLENPLRDPRNIEHFFQVCVKTPAASTSKRKLRGQFNYINLIKEETKIEPPKQKEVNLLQIFSKKMRK